jgi:hemin uptake protein HemP
MLASQYEPTAVTAAADPVSGASVYAAPASTPTVESTHLLHGQREMLIRHGNEVYRLRHTRNDKLILTK